METDNQAGRPPLGREVLRDVSRSFYLSLRFLPRGFREPAGLGYLLARLSDTIADAGTLAVAERAGLLARFRELAAGLPATGSVAQFARDLEASMNGAGLPAGERTLVARTGDVFMAAAGLEGVPREAVRKVIAIIVAGQEWDLTRFEGDQCVVLGDRNELEHYAYQVAGCVGEFWTELAYDCRTNPAREERGQMDDWARNYGRGLQLVNILRDVPEDLRRGRCYVPGADPGDRAALLKAAGEWRTRAREWLDDGLRYVDALRGFRLKVASGLPVLLGVQTLDLLDGASWDDWERGVKVTRRDVKRTVLRAVALSSPLLPGRWTPQDGSSGRL